MTYSRDAMPEYVKCIQHGTADQAHRSYCGRDLTAEFAFKDIDHAACNTLAGGRLLNCPDCVKVVVDLLIRGSWDSDVIAPAIALERQTELATESLLHHRISKALIQFRDLNCIRLIDLLAELPQDSDNTVLQELGNKRRAAEIELTAALAAYDAYVAEGPKVKAAVAEHMDTVAELEAASLLAPDEL